MATNCKAIRAEIEEHAGDPLWPSRGAAAHLEACAGCLDFLRERESLRRLVGGLERVEAPGDFEFRLRARMAAAKERKRERFLFPRLAPGLASVALAAVFVASVAAAYYFKRTAPNVAGHDASRQASTQTPATTQQPSSVANTKTTPPLVEVSNAENKQQQASPSADDEKAAVVRPSKQERRRAHVARAAAPSEPRVDVAREAGTLEFGLSTTQVIKGTNVELVVPAKPLRVVVRDEHGTPRRLAMRPVSFGAQNPVGKRAAPPKGTLVADNEGVW